MKNKNLYKYPRTPHLPWSANRSEDDIGIVDCSNFEGKNVIVTVKYDGENTTVYHDDSHARSVDSRDHASRHWLKNYVSHFNYKLSDGMRICGENLFAKHSIKYINLKSYFYVFSIWIETICIDWPHTVEICREFNLDMVDVIYNDIWNEEKIKVLCKNFSFHNGNEVEGLVIRISDSFKYDDFSKCVAKYVRKNHVQTDSHWMNSAIEKNELRLEEI